MPRVATLILDDPTTGTPGVWSFDMDKMKPGNLPSRMGGPFRYKFTLEDKNGPKDFEATLVMDENRLQVAFQEYPIIAKVLDEYTITGPQLRILEFGDKRGKDTIMRLKASIFGKTHIWLNIQGGAITGGSYDANAKTCHALPFYNFYNHGEVCLGSCDVSNNPLRQLNNFLGSYTTPHTTFTDKTLVFKPNKDLTQVVTERVPKCDRFDYNIDRRLFEMKPIASLSPL